MMRIGLVLLLFLVGKTLLAQSAHTLRREGDRAYERSEYRDAEQAYRKAGETTASVPDVAYNTGNAIYQQGNYAESERFYEQAARTGKQPKLQADAFHNLGNALLKQNKYEQAVQAYENSLRKRPGDPETKANLQLAKKKLQQQQEQQQQQNNQDQNNQQQSQSQNDQQQPDQQQNNQQQENQDQEQQGQQEQQQNNQDQQQPQPSDGRMTPEQARRLLETAVAPEDKRNARKYREMEPGKHQVQTKKDW